MGQTYTVKAGDTLYGISNQFGVSVVELATLNNVNGANLQIGQVLNIPSTSGSNPDNMFIYTVVKDDSLYKIAMKYGTTVDAIMKLNNLKSTNLLIGQSLRIPETYVNGNEMTLPEFINYTVKKGDTLYAISKLYNVAVDTIMQDNSLTTGNLSIGQNLKIRTSASSGVVEECFGEDYNAPSTNTTTYTVKKGDSLYQIALKYNTSVSNIVALNNLKSTNLSIGQQLIVPISGTSSPTSQTTYVVKKGDSLYAIAKKYNTTVDSIKSKNNLKSNALSIGQILYI